MTYRDVIKQLKELGTAQNRKIYGRHGYTGKMYGVSYANLGKLKKKIKVDQALAERLWKSGNIDARALALMVADPEGVSDRQIESWAKDIDNYGLAGELSGLVKRTPLALKKMEKWCRAKGEFHGQAGWNILTHMAMTDPDLADAFFEKRLQTIEKEIHTRKNRVRHAMNNAVIAIGIRNRKLEKKAAAAAKRIGRVEVDHGDTSCKTPDAVAYIRKTITSRGHRF